MIYVQSDFPYYLLLYLNLKRPRVWIARENIVMFSDIDRVHSTLFPNFDLFYKLHYDA